MTAIVPPRIRPAVMCPDHPDCELLPVGTAARGTCPADYRTYQMETPEVTW